MRGEDLVQRFPEILQQMKAISNLGRLGRALTSALGIGARPIPRNHLHPGGLPEPLRHRLGRALRQECYGLAALQVHEDRAIGMAFPQCPIIHAQHAGCRGLRLRLAAEPAQERVPTHPHVPGVTEAHPGCAPQRHTEGEEALGQPQRAARPGGGDGRQTFREDAAAAAAIGAKPLADAQLQPHTVLRPGQVGEGACVVTMDAPRWSGAERTGRADLGRLHAQGDLCGSLIDLAGLKVQQGRIG